MPHQILTSSERRTPRPFRKAIPSVPLPRHGIAADSIACLESEVTSKNLDQWSLNDHDDDEYNRHLSNVTKVRVREGKRIVERWTTKTAGARKDYHDLESYQLALAHGPARVFALPSPEQVARHHQQMQQAAAAKPVSGGVKAPDGRAFFATQRR